MSYIKAISLSFLFSLVAAGMVYAETPDPVDEAAAPPSGQKGDLRAVLVDESTGEAVVGAVVEIAPLADTAAKRYLTSVYGGEVSIPGLAYGDYVLKASFLGYKDAAREVKVNRASVNLGRIAMRQEATRIDAVVAEGQAMRTSQRGDTLSYNAGAYKVAQDASAESLLSKMPGITVIDGQVEAQGETVEKIYVDGREFFGQDVSTTIKTIPAEVISHVEVYNKLSDQSEFTGIDDGEGFKAINIVTTVNKGQFGKMYGTWGIDDKYSFGANINMFNGDHRFSFLGMANNINQQNFAIEDILGAMNSGGGMSSRGGGRMRGGYGFMTRPLDGVSTTQSVGINYSGKWKDKVEVDASYFFTNVKNENDSETEREYIDGRNWLYDAYSNSETRNNEHRFNVRATYNINDNHSLMLRSRISFQNYKYSLAGLAETFESAGYPAGLVRSDSTNTNSRRWGYSMGNTLIYRVKLGKPGRTLTIDAGLRMSNNDRREDAYSLADIISGSRIERDQQIKNDTRNYTLSSSAVYTEPINDHSQLSAEYRVSYDYSDADKKSFLWNGADYVFTDNLSNIYDSGYLTHRVGPGYNYSKDGTKMNASVYYEHGTLKNDYDFPSAYKQDRSFENVVYRMRFEHAFNPTNTIRLDAFSWTEKPSISQLQEVVDISNTQFVTGGNPALDPAYQHRVFANYIRSNISKGTTFMVMGGFRAQGDHIGDYVITDENSASLPADVTLEPGGQYSSYKNMSGYWSVDGGVNYGFPLKPLKSNLNLGLNATYSETPSMLNDMKNTLRGQYYFGSVVLGSNISEKVDFTLTYNAGYNVAKNTVNSNYNNEYMTQYFAASFKVVAWAGFTFSGNFAYTQNKGITDDYNDELVMCNLYIGKKVFRNKRGEIIFGVNDLFDQNDSFRRNVTTQYVENVRSNALGRWFSLQFVFNLRTFGSQGGRSSGGGQMPMGPPPGGMHHR